MSDWVKIIELFLSKTVAHNTRLLLSLIVVIVFYSLFHNKPIFLEIKTNYGNAGIGICIFLFWLTLFIIINLIADKLSVRRKLRQQRKAELKHKEQNIIKIYDNLNSLSESQKSLLERFVLQNKNQFQDYEIGGYKAIWGRDIEVLKTKKIITIPAYGVYEISKEYFDCIATALNQNDINNQEEK